MGAAELVLSRILAARRGLSCGVHPRSGGSLEAYPANEELGKPGSYYVRHRGTGPEATLNTETRCLKSHFVTQM